MVAKLGGEQQIKRALFAFAGDDAAEKQGNEQKHGSVLHAAHGVKHRLSQARHDAQCHLAVLHVEAVFFPDDPQGEEQDQSVQDAVKEVAFAAGHLHHLLGKDRPEKQRQEFQHGPLQAPAVSGVLYMVRTKSATILVRST